MWISIVMNGCCTPILQMEMADVTTLDSAESSTLQIGGQFYKLLEARGCTKSQLSLIDSVAGQAGLAIEPWEVVS